MKTIYANHRSKSASEKCAQGIMTLCALMAVFAVLSITVYMIQNGLPALLKVGVKELLFGTVETQRRDTQLWNSLCNPDFHHRHSGSHSSGCAYRTAHRRISGRGCSGKSGSGSETRSRAVSRNSFCYLRTVRADDFKSSDV